MGDRAMVSPARSFAQMNEEIAANLRRVYRRILTVSATHDTFTAGAQAVAVSTSASPSFTTIAQLSVLPGSWVIYGTTSVNNGPLGHLSSGTAEVLCRIRAGGVTLISLDHMDPSWHPAVGGVFVGHNFAPITRVTFATQATITMEVSVQSTASPTPANSLAERTRLVVAPY